MPIATRVWLIGGAFTCPQRGCVAHANEPCARHPRGAGGLASCRRPLCRSLPKMSQRGNPGPRTRLGVALLRMSLQPCQGLLSWGPLFALLCTVPTYRARATGWQGSGLQVPGVDAAHLAVLLGPTVLSSVQLPRWQAPLPQRSSSDQTSMSCPSHCLRRPFRPLCPVSTCRLPTSLGSPCLTFTLCLGPAMCWHRLPRRLCPVDPSRKACPHTAAARSSLRPLPLGVLASACSVWPRCQL